MQFMWEIEEMVNETKQTQNKNVKTSSIFLKSLRSSMQVYQQEV